ncbi:aromatic compound degradation protein PaaI [Mycobacterium intermedium]|uniref:Aromatic compound degradation protein PaaI n=1 Tax=Mycobacterium intermedium TaxID=28445 RepID=A0A1E3SKL6_MYCIE|nr:PaaI family thioesterase [Mycobacterium intermedium]MCV6962954.1 PaaI family thioesterase [Mycobacterium intermedium]ODR02659.1 aromatic compound degradation protein PaaI [Mycobacterium intermedium]OPE51951.1 aromatic compound degradation protein PaaI [Mycobacterium intermedium]ORB10329.1 aromatic compound degradation protein PaaI [Mycobacterium intermedium]
MTDTVFQAPATDRTRVIEWADPAITASAARSRSGLEFLQAMVDGELPPPPIMQTLGARLESVADGRAVFTLTPAESHYNPIGSVHGGVYATLLDSAAACAVHSMLPAGVGYTSLDLEVRFIGAISVKTGPVTCTGTVKHLGRRTALAEAVLTDDNGKLLASATSNCLLFRP